MEGELSGLEETWRSPVIDEAVKARFEARMVLLHGSDRSDTPCWGWWSEPRHETYGAMTLWREDRGKRITTLAHRISWAIHCGPIPAGMCICHTCDNRSCVNPSHLFLGTKSDNALDMLAKGRGRFGEKNHWSTISDEGVAALREDLANGMTGRAAAKKYGISEPYVSRLKLWKSRVPGRTESGNPVPQPIGGADR